jgi:ribosomal-protein-alanine N-acetyltransferase
MRVADLPAVLGIEQEAFAGDPPWTLGQLRDELDQVPDGRHYVVAANGDGRVVGYAGLAAGPDDADVVTLAVAAGQRRAGVGRALLTALVAEARRRGCRAVLLEVRSANAPARGLYARAGFAEIATRPRYYADGADAVVLRRDLR